MTVEKLLADIRGDFERILGDNLVGIYVHGSLVFGCFRWEKSDVDFLAVVREPLPHEEQVALIRALMMRTPDAPPKGVEMSVVLESVCRNFVHPTPFEAHFSNVHLEDYEKDIDGHCRELYAVEDPDLAAHFSVVYAAGRTLCGRPVREVFAPVPKEYVLDSILWDVEEPGDDPLYHTLNLCRVYAYKKDGLSLSKAQGIPWAIENLPEVYRPLLRHALECYTSEAEFTMDASDFHAYMHGLLFEQ